MHNPKAWPMPSPPACATSPSCAPTWCWPHPARCRTTARSSRTRAATSRRHNWLRPALSRLHVAARREPAPKLKATWRSPSAFALDPGLLHHLGPLGALGLHEGGELLRRAAAVFGAVGVEALLHVGHRQHGVDVGVDLLRDRARQLAGPDQAVPGGGFEVGEAFFLHRRHARVALGAFGARLCDRDHAAVLHMWRG